jgi:hypothetical protein
MTSARTENNTDEKAWHFQTVSQTTKIKVEHGKQCKSGLTQKNQTNKTINNEDYNFKN